MTFCTKRAQERCDYFQFWSKFSEKVSDYDKETFWQKAQINFGVMDSFIKHQNNERKT